MVGGKISGLALGSIFTGSVFLYAGISGKSIPSALQLIIQGKDPRRAKAANPITGAPAVPAVSAGNFGSGSGDAIAADALRYQGAGYVWGGAPAQGMGNWDCSSFANWVIGHDIGLAIPGYPPGGAYTGATHGPPTVAWLPWPGCDTIGHDGAVAQPGDLAVWETHMGICLGPNQMISAQNPNDGTQVSAINGFIPEILFIRRLKAVEGGTPAGSGVGRKPGPGGGF